MTEIKIKENDVGKRIDNFLSRCYPTISKVLIFKLIRTKKVKLNKKAVKNDTRLNLDDVITIYYHLEKEEKDSSFLRANKKLSVVYEDKNLIIIDKPVGLIAHEDATHIYDTAINRIKKYLYEKKEYDFQNENIFSPTLVNRLDRNTSGLMMAAKNSQALEELNYLIKNRLVEKTYYSIVHGNFNKQTLKTKHYLLKDEKFVKVYTKQIKGSKEAITEFSFEDSIRNFTLLRINLITGRTHQIRAVLNFLNFPILGEQKYIRKGFTKLQKEFKHQILLAQSIKFKENNLKLLSYLSNEEFELDYSELYKIMNYLDSK